MFQYFKHGYRMSWRRAFTNSAIFSKNCSCWWAHYQHSRVNWDDHKAKLKHLKCEWQLNLKKVLRYSKIFLVLYRAIFMLYFYSNLVPYDFSATSKTKSVFVCGLDSMHITDFGQQTREGVSQVRYTCKILERRNSIDLKMKGTKYILKI